jgi:uncharacterized protein (DUF1800 family)
MAPTALPPLDKVDPVQAWQRWEPTAEAPFDLKWAGHLLRRATFGGTLAEMRQAVKQGPDAAIDRLINGEPHYRALANVRQADGKAVTKKNEVFYLRLWWLYWMTNGGHPLRERMTLFWHNHFATSVNKVKSTRLMFKQNETLREHALGKFHPFLLAMSQDPAMLIWLDSNSNVKAHPNENYAREIMELFSLGVHNYTETDIREAARAFTGWHTDGEEYEFNSGFHDYGEKTVLKQSGKWDGGDIVRILLEQPACARFLVRKLYREFVSENQTPPDSFLEPLCEQMRKSDYDIAGVMRTMLGSRHFFSGYAFRQRIKSPVEFAIGAVRSVVSGRLPQSVLINRLEVLGQDLFAPPNVKGWTGAQAWLNTSTILSRQNFGQTVAMGTIFNNAPTRGPGRFEAVDLEPPDFDEAPVPAPGAPGKPATRPSRPEEPPPPTEFDPARVIHEEKVTSAEDIVRILLDTHLPGGISKTAHAKLVAFVDAGKPKDKALDRRVRETVHAIMCMPEYQLA